MSFTSGRWNVIAGLGPGPGAGCLSYTPVSPLPRCVTQGKSLNQFSLWALGRSNSAYPVVLGTLIKERVQNPQDLAQLLVNVICD